MIKKLRSQEELYPAETYFQYSNLGMALAGEVVVAVSGMAYADYVKKNILNPLGLGSTYTEIPGEQRGKRLATGYSPRLRDGSRKVPPFFQVRGIAPAAGFASTVEDLARFASWQLKLLEEGGEEVLKASTFKEMQPVHWIDPNWKTTWGLGFEVERRNDLTFVGHSGMCPGYRTDLMLCPGKKICVIVMAHAHDANRLE